MPCWRAGLRPPRWSISFWCCTTVSYTHLADQDTKYARQSGGKGQYGHVKIKIEPNEPGKGYEFINAVVGGAIPKEFIGPIDQGIQGAMQAGVLAGYPVVDVKVTLYDLSLIHIYQPDWRLHGG